MAYVIGKSLKNSHIKNDSSTDIKNQKNDKNQPLINIGYETEAKKIIQL